MRYVKKPVVVEAIDFATLVAYGLTAPDVNIVNGMPWSFTYKGHPITHENDLCYLIPTLALDDIVRLGIPPEHQESALKAYVAGFFAGHGAATGESRIRTRQN